MSKGASHAPGKFRGRRPALEEPPISVTGRERDGCRAGQFLDRRTAPCSRALPPNPPSPRAGPRKATASALACRLPSFWSYFRKTPLGFLSRMWLFIGNNKHTFESKKKRKNEGTAARDAVARPLRRVCCRLGGQGRGGGGAGPSAVRRTHPSRGDAGDWARFPPRSRAHYCPRAGRTRGPGRGCRPPGAAAGRPLRSLGLPREAAPRTSEAEGAAGEAERGPDWAAVSGSASRTHQPDGTPKAATREALGARVLRTMRSQGLRIRSVQGQWAAFARFPVSLSWPQMLS